MMSGDTVINVLPNLDRNTFFPANTPGGRSPTAHGKRRGKF
jgi:hypothetical protein